jgi:hypothetical protein
MKKGLVSLTTKQLNASGYSALWGEVERVAKVMAGQPHENYTLIAGVLTHWRG